MEAEDAGEPGTEEMSLPGQLVLVPSGSGRNLKLSFFEPDVCLNLFFFQVHLEALMITLVRLLRQKLQPLKT